MRASVIVSASVFCVLAASIASAKDVVLQDFEKPGAYLEPRLDLRDKSGKPVMASTLNPHWATSGRRSLQMSFRKYEVNQSQYPGTIMLLDKGDFAVSDWSKYGQFALDIRNECPETIKVTVEIRSDPNRNGYCEWVFIKPNQIETLKVNIQNAWKKSQYNADMSGIKKIIVYSTRPDGNWKYSIDNMRLLDNLKELHLSSKVAQATTAIEYLHDASVRGQFEGRLKELVDGVNKGRINVGEQLDTAFEKLMSELMSARYTSEWFFNFGPDGQASKAAGWKQVTPASRFSDESGFGWVGSPEVSAKAVEAHAGWGFNKDKPYVTAKQAPSIWLNEQQAGCISSLKPAEFRAKMPNGEYRVMLITGYPGEELERFCPVDMTAAIQGQPHRITLAERKIFKTHIFDATVADGTLTVAFSRNIGHPWIINAIAAWPVEAHDRAWSEFVAPLRDNIRIMGEQERAELLDDRREKPQPRTNVPAEHKEYGFAPFAVKDLCDYPSAYTPSSYGINGPLACRVARNEIAAVRFGLLPLANAPFHLKVVAGELKGPGGTIPASAVRVRMIENTPWAPDITRRVLVELPRAMHDAYEGAWQWRPWQATVMHVAVKLPDGTRAGLYEGSLQVTAGEMKTLTIPVKIEVLPVDIHLDPSYTYGAYWYWYVEKSEARVISEIENMRDHGFNMVPTWRVSIKGAVKDGRIEWTIGQPDKIVGMLRERGLLRPIPMAIETHVRFAMKELHNVVPQKCPVDVPLPPEFYDNITSLVAKIEEWRKANDLPEVYYYTMDEICDYRLAKKLGDAVKKVPGAKLFSNSNSIIQDQLGDMVDLACYAYEGYTKEQDLAKKIAARKNTIVWTYPNSVLNSPPTAARLLYGFSGRKIGFKGLWPWAYNSWSGSPNSPYDGYYADFVCVYPELDAPIDTCNYEEIRRGIDDGRYLDTAAAMINRLDAKGTPQAKAAADEARRGIQMIMNEVTFTYLDEESMKAGQEKCPQWRTRLQDIVLKLNDALQLENSNE
ncbi:MAG: DUF4091 domain-containing protein [Planctomycetes bacterium]|nr:DUF4091 domain-containing protein [Planctomycetota bacterium]